MNKNAEAKKIVVLAMDGLKAALIEELNDSIDEMEAMKVYDAQDLLIKQLEKEHGGRRWITECFKTEKLVIGEGISRQGVRGFVATDENTGVIVSARPSLESLNIDLAKRQAANKPGRPVELSEGRKVNTYLDAESIAIATRIGDGNVSDGIRKSLKIADSKESFR